MVSPGSPHYSWVRRAGPLGPARRQLLTKKKSKAFVKAMFPGKLASCSVPASYNYPAPLPLRGRISEGQVCRHLANLSPHKATGMDGIPNVVLKECTDILVPYLVHIFRAMFKYQAFFGQWKRNNDLRVAQARQAPIRHPQGV